MKSHWLYDKQRKKKERHGDPSAGVLQNKTFLWSLNVFVLGVRVLCLSTCLCTLWAPGALKGQKRASYPLGLEWQTVVSHLVGAGNLARILWISSFNHWSISPAPGRNISNSQNSKIASFSGLPNSNDQIQRLVSKNAFDAFFLFSFSFYLFLGIFLKDSKQNESSF